MKLKHIKEILDNLSSEELEQDLIYNSEEYYISGTIKNLVKAEVDYYNTGEYDPAQLYTEKQLKEEGYDKEDIEEFYIEIPKGNYYIEL